MSIDKVTIRFEMLQKRNNKTLQSIYEIMVGDVLETPAAQWLDDSGQIVTKSFSDLDKDVHSMAAFLTRKIGENQRGTCIGLAMDNSYLWQVCFWALLMSGFKPVLIDVNQKEEMLDYIIECAAINVIIGKTGLILRNKVQQIPLEELTAHNS
jgi:long-subunit acyl-CoA synthetase (AMP-forming)